MEKQAVQVVIIDDHQLIIDGLKAILQDEDDVDFAGGANNMEEALKLLDEHHVDVALIDISIPEHSGMEITRRIRESHPNVKVLALTMHEDMNMITGMIEAGASGYVLKRANMSEVLEAIQVIAGGNKFLGREVQAIMMGNYQHKEPTIQTPKDVPALLTNREKEILKLIAREYSTADIANSLFISERTVDTHRRNILTKTDAKSIVGLIKYAIRFGLINKEDIGEKSFIKKNSGGS